MWRKKDIVKVERGFNYEKIILSCNDEIRHPISIKGATTFRDAKLIKYFPQFMHLIGSEQRRAIVNINRAENWINLKVEEQNEKGEWMVVEEQEKPFS